LATPLRGRYLVRDSTAYLYLRSADALFSLVAGGRPPAKTPPRRVVIGVGGHLGDAILATGFVASIRERIPEADIGIVGSRLAQSIFGDHPAVQRFHLRDHWKANRTESHVAALRRSWRTFGRVRKELRAAAYDTAVDLYPFYPNLAVLFWRAGIPRRIGFASGGGGPLYSTAVEWTERPEHMTRSQGRLLEEFGIPGECAERYVLPPIPDEAIRMAAQLLDSRGVAASFTILHPGTGSQQKAWPMRDWIQLARAQVARGNGVVITGAGATEAALAQAIIREVPEVASLVGLTSIPVLRAVLTRASIAYAVDSAAAHLAAAEGIPSVVLMTPNSDPVQWRPLSERTRMVFTSAELIEK
jgi:ADP-heptose:LPS heptosyltransferase